MSLKQQVLCPLCGMSLILRLLKLADGQEVLAYNTAYTHLVDHLLAVGRSYDLTEEDWEVEHSE